VTSHFDNLEYDIKQMLKGNHASETLEISHSTSERIVALAKGIASHTLDMASHKPPRIKSPTDKTIRMSEVGAPCHRKLLYSWYSPMRGLPPYADENHPYLPVKFTYGDYIEELVLFLCEEAGHTVADRQKEVTLHVKETVWYAVGHMDATIDGHVVDIKSSADVSFNKYKREGLTEENDSFGYLYQIDSYAMAHGTDDRAVIFTNKHDGEIYIAHRSGVDFMPVETKIKVLGDDADLYIATGEMPIRLEPKVTKYGKQLNTVCSYCNFKHTCYDGGILGVIASGRPQYFLEETITSEGYAYIKDKAKIAKPKGFAKTKVEV
jgi:hypothetical protein